MNIFDIAPLSEWRTLYKVARSSINNDTAPTLTRSILRCDLLTFRLLRQYAHRNGETQPPTVPGQYWFCGYATTRYSVVSPCAIKGLTSVINDDGVLSGWVAMWDDGFYEPVTSFAGRWWGPIAPPWEWIT